MYPLHFVSNSITFIYFCATPLRNMLCLGNMKFEFKKNTFVGRGVGSIPPNINSPGCVIVPKKVKYDKTGALRVCTYVYFISVVYNVRFNIPTEHATRVQAVDIYQW